MRYIKFHGGNFNVRTHDIGLPVLNELSILHRIYELYSNGLYDLSVNFLDVLSITISPRDIRGFNELSITGLKILSVNVHLCDIRESVDVISESSLPGMNGLGLESSQNVLNVLNDLGQ